MAGLVDRVKQSIRSRSRSRKSISGSPRASQEFSRASVDAPRYRESQDDRSPRSATATHAPSAWHVHSGGQAAPSGQVNKPLPVNPPTAVTPTVTNDELRDNDADLAARRGSVTRKPVAPSTADVVPPRSSSTRQSLPPTQVDGPVANGHTNRAQDKSLVDTMNSLNFDDTGAVTVHSPTSSKAPVSNGVANAAANTRANVGQHVRLPENFHMGHTEHTDVQTQYRPAVTHETVHRERTEIIQEAITRDIHVHHYYTYLQPIKVVEVLPAKHFVLDEKTGLKREIAAPAGWILPESMQARVPEVSHVKGTTRHYLVNEQHPRGVLEAPPAASTTMTTGTVAPGSPPLRHKADHERLQTKPIGQAL